MIRHVQLALLALLLAPTMARSAEHAIDIGHSKIRIHVGKAGVFSGAGHEHWVTAPIADGQIEDASPGRISFRVKARDMKVEEDQSLSADKQAEVQQTMQTQVLESDRYPEITFRSTTIKETASDTWEVHGDLSLHGQSRPLQIEVRKEQNAYVGHSRLKQTDFGIHPVRAGGGMVKVKDELEIEFSIMPGH